MSPRVTTTPKLSCIPFGNYSFICRGTGIEWPDLDYHLSIESMLAYSEERQVA
ncbi:MULTISPECIES: DUF2442 domain-containing protein [unclassified Thiocapsa]|uniref:DUF2442 domain-containing protein n=1 Tax=unclassified Thiocapsa TaxID=2641286 RepID=UPI0035B02A02